jgi:hypothetical protein
VRRDGEVAESARGDLLQTRVLDQEAVAQQLGGTRVDQLDAVFVCTDASE